MTISNAKITSTMLGIEDHGIMSFTVYVEWPGAGCGFGGYCLDAHAGEGKRRVGHGHSYQAIRHLLETVGATKWEDLRGKLVRVEDQGPSGRLTKIGHIMEDRWFDIEAYMKEGEVRP